MSWARLDDRFYTHRKVRRALRRSRSAIALHVLGITYACDQLTDGFVDDDFVLETLPDPLEREEALGVLIEAGLWVEAVDGFVIHDYLDYNPPASAVLERRRNDAERKARGRASSKRAQPVRADSARIPGGVRTESARPDPTPTQLPPLPPRTRGGRKREQSAYDKAVKDLAAAMYPTSREAVFVVRGALSEGATTHRQVREYVARWRPDLGGDEA